MELRQLKTFSTVAKALSFTRAAELLDYAQSSVTAQIRSLEDELGTKLFERLGRRVTLTKEGEQLLLYADQILKLAREAKEVVSGSASPRGTLSIGAVESLCVFRLPTLLQEYRKSCPDVEIILKLGTCTDFHGWLRKNIIDVAFSLDRALAETDLKSQTLLSEPMVVVARTGHHLAEKDYINPADIEGECLILTESGCSYREVFENVLTETGVQPGSILEFGSVEAIKQCVISGLGVTLLPLVAVKKELLAGQLVNLNWSGPDLDISMQLVHHKDKWISPALRLLLDTAPKVFKCSE